MERGKGVELHFKAEHYYNITAMRENLPAALQTR